MHVPLQVYWLKQCEQKLNRTKARLKILSNSHLQMSLKTEHFKGARPFNQLAGSSMPQR